MFLFVLHDSVYYDWITDSCYDDLYSRVSLTLDQQVNNAVAKELLTMDPGHTKTELVLDHLRDGAVSILKRWPDMKSKLHMCLNMPLPTKLRSVAWTLFLSNSQGTLRYSLLVWLSIKPCPQIYTDELGFVPNQ